MPHVTTDPSPKIAAKAVLEARICCTFFSWSWTELLSPPWFSSPHVTKDPSAMIGAKAEEETWICCAFFSWSCTAGRPTIFTSRPDRQTVYYFTIPLFHFHWVTVGRPFLHLGPQNLHVGPPFSPVGRPFLHLGPQNLHVGPPFSPVGRPFLHLGPQNLHVGPPFSPVGRPFLHLGPQNLHVGSRFCMSAKRIPMYHCDAQSHAAPIPLRDPMLP